MPLSSEWFIYLTFLLKRYHWCSYFHYKPSSFALLLKQFVLSLWFFFQLIPGIVRNELLISKSVRFLTYISLHHYLKNKISNISPNRNALFSSLVCISNWFYYGWLRNGICIVLSSTEWGFINLCLVKRGLRNSSCSNISTTLLVFLIFEFLLQTGTFLLCDMQISQLLRATG